MNFSLWRTIKKQWIHGGKSRVKGFTLAELLIAIAILGILATLAIPRLFPQTEHARASEAISILSAIRQGEEAYFLQNGQYLGQANVNPVFTWNLLGMDDPNPTSVLFVYTVASPNANTFTATATRTAINAGTGNATKTITIDETGTFGGDHPFVPQ